MHETFAEEVERRRPERETKPESCTHCSCETTELTNYSRHYGGNVGAHWLCVFCEHTQSASRLGAGLHPNDTVQDIASMLHILLDKLTERP